MIAVDTNILVPFMRTEYPQHERAVDCIRGLAEGATAWALPCASPTVSTNCGRQIAISLVFRGCGPAIHWLVDAAGAGRAL